MDVEQLNERLEVKGADRIRHSGIAPDEAHGVRLLPLFFLSLSLSDPRGASTPAALS